MTDSKTSSLPIEFEEGEAEFLLGHLMSNSEDLLYLILLENKEFVFVNRKFEETLGYTIEDLQSEKFQFGSIISTDSLEEVEARDERRKRGEIVENQIRFWAITKDGRNIPLHASVIELYWRGKPAILGIARDISLETEHLDHLKETIRINQMILDNIPTGIVLLDRFLRMRYVNPKAQEFFGKTNSEMLGKPFLEYVEPQIRETIIEFTRSGPSRGIIKSPITLTQVSPRPRYTQWYFATIHQNEEIVMIQAILVDMTEIISRQKELERKNRKLVEVNNKLETLNKKLDEFVAITSHDLKAPARRIATFGTLLQNSPNLDPNEQEQLRMLVETSRHLVSMIDAFVNFSRLDKAELNFQSFEMEKIIDFVIRMSLKEIIAKNDAEIVISRPLPKIYGDYKLMSQVWQNLIQNAIKFSRDGIPPVIEIFAETKKGYALFYCKDNGIGIPRDKNKVIFEMFTRVHNEEKPGTGIGLSIVQKIIEMHGGKIWVETNEDGVGSTFVFSIPLHSYQ